MASPSKDATPMWDIMSPEDDKAVLEKFTAESNKVINRWSLGDATFTEKDAAVSFLVQLGAVEITVQSGSQQTAPQKQVSIVFGDGEDSKIGEEHREADPGDTKDAIPSEVSILFGVGEVPGDTKDALLREGNQVKPAPDSSDQDTEKKNEIPVMLDQDTKKNGEAKVNDDDDDEDNNYSYWMTEPDDYDDGDNQIPDSANVVEKSSIAQPREEHPCPNCHTVLNSLWELDLHRLSSCKQVYNCDQCSKSFTAKGYAVKHLQKVHNMSSMEAVKKLKDLKSTERQKRKRRRRKKRPLDKNVLRRSKRLRLKLQPLSNEWIKILESKSVDVSEITSTLSPVSDCEPVDEESEVTEIVSTRDDVKKENFNRPAALENNDLEDHGCTSEQVQEKHKDDSITMREDESLTADRGEGNGATMPTPRLQKREAEVESSGRKSSELLSEENQNQGCSAELVTEENKDVLTSPRCAGQTNDLDMKDIEETTHNFSEQMDGSHGVMTVKETKEDDSMHDNIVTNQKRAKFKSVRSRDYHISITHPEDVPAYKCSTCNKSYKERSSFKNHLKIHMDLIGREKYQMHMKSHADKAETSVCDTCGIVLSSKRGLERHINSKHKKEVLYTCEICGQNFYATSNIKRHLETHTKERIWKCDECGYATFREPPLREHIRSVHLSGKCLCEFCGSAYKNRASLRKHIRTYHTNVYNYSCDLCDMKFKSSTHVFCHKRKVHSYKPENKPVKYRSGPSKSLTMVSDSEDRAEVGHLETNDAVAQISEASESQVVREALLAMIND